MFGVSQGNQLSQGLPRPLEKLLAPYAIAPTMGKRRTQITTDRLRLSEISTGMQPAR